MRIILRLMVMTAVLPGCSKGESQPQAAGGAPSGPAVASGKAEEKPKVSRGGGVFGVRDQEQSRRVLRDIGLACQVEDVGRLPQTLEELKAIVKDSPLAYKAVDNGEYVLVAGAQPRHDSLFLYERDPDSRGNRLVLMGDGTVHKKSAEEFAALAK